MQQFQRRFRTTDSAKRELHKAARRWSAADQESLSHPDVEGALGASLAGAFAQGSSGAIEEAHLLGRPWGFEPEAIDAHVQVWHGLDDTQVKPRVARAMAARLRNCTPHWIAGEGHVSLISNHAETILASTIRET